MLNIRWAKGDESKVLTKIAIESESYWGYDFDYIEKFKAIYKVTEEFINNNPTFIIEKGKNIIGFYSILINRNETSLEYFFIKPKFIGKGYGKILWNHMVEYGDNFGIKDIVIVTSPEAKGFYTKMGAIQTCEIESLVKKERKIPKLIYTFEK